MWDTLCKCSQRSSCLQVYSALTDDGQIVAVKQIQLDTTNWEQAETDYKLIQREVDIQKTLNHPNIVK